MTPAMEWLDTVWLRSKGIVARPAAKGSRSAAGVVVGSD